MADETRSGEPVRVEIVCPLCDGESPSVERDIGLCCKCNNGREPVHALLAGRDALVYRLGLAVTKVDGARSVDQFHALFSEYVEPHLAALRAFDAKEGENDGNSRET